MAKIFLLVDILLLNILLCLAIISPDDEVTKPPKRWQYLPWPPPDIHSRHSGVKIPNSGVILHVKSPPGQFEENKPTRIGLHSNWDIIPDPENNDGLKLVQSSSSLPGNSWSENVPGSDTHSEYDAHSHQGTSSVLAAGMASAAVVTSGVSSAGGLQQPSANLLGQGMTSGSLIGSGVSVPGDSQWNSPQTLGSGMTSGSVIGTGVSVTSDSQKPPRYVLGMGVSSGGAVGAGASTANQHNFPGSGYHQIPNIQSGQALGSGYNNNQQLNWNQGSSSWIPNNEGSSQFGQGIFINGQQQVQTGSQWNVDPANSNSQDLYTSSSQWNFSPSNIAFNGDQWNVGPGWANSQHSVDDDQLQFLPASHWHASLSHSADQQHLPVSGAVMVPATGYQQSSSLGSGLESAFVSTVETAKCPDGATGQFVYRPDCRRFLNCWKGRGFVQFCAPGTLFNPDTLECDFPSKVKCLKLSQEEERWNHVEINQPEETHIARESRLLEITSTPRPSTVAQPPPPLPVVSPKKDCPMEGGTGLAPHPTDCSKFLNCWKGTAHTQQCGPGTLFNPQTLQCDFPYNVNCIVTDTDNHDNAPGKFSPNKPNQPSEQVKPITHPTKSTPKTTPRITPTTSTTTPSTTTKATTTATATTATTTTTSTTTTSTTTTTTLSPPRNNEGTTLAENPSGQVIRLRGGPGPWEGYVELQGQNAGWGLMCDEKNSWTIAEASVVCQQLGYERGAELSWQGRPLRPTEDTLRVSVNKVLCNGDEPILSACRLEPHTSLGRQCIIARDAVAVRCYRNWVSQCQPGEVNHGKKCYHLVVPSIRHAHEGFTHGEALRDCQSRGAHLLDITSQEENDFISEWLLQLHPNITNVITAGVGVSVLQRPLWVWEGSIAPFHYTKWWPGWTNDLKHPPTIGERPICVVAKRVFPCEHAYYASDGITDIDAHSHEHYNVRMCAANYFYWDTEDCSITHSHPYICERPHDDIGCLDVDKYNYQGTANVTASGLPCIPWDDPTVIRKLSYRVSERERLASLVGHNYCRNVGGDNQPWCYAGKQKTREPCSIPTCWSKVVEKTVNLIVHGCWTSEFECQPGECIASKWKCDGEKDCTNGRDEENCGGFFQEFTKTSNSRLDGHDREKWLRTDAKTCAQHCRDSKQFVCRSFSHHVQDSVCLLSDSNVGLSGKLVSQKGWDYYETNSYSVHCDDKFRCSNGKCVNASQVCNGKNDCGDRSDEKNCSAEYLGYEIRLAGSNISNEGRIEVKVFGQWGLICDDLFGLRDAEVVCRELGFSLGAAEVLPPGSYINRDKGYKTSFLVDDLKCLGNESSILECEFEGWGVHDCLPEEAVSVVCRVPGLACADNLWQCEKSKECIPITYLCDNIDDCDDSSDEDSTRCNLPIEVRLAGGSSNMEGRVEVRYRGIWGTVCDDDFATSAATVICRSLGFGGPAQAKKEAAFGSGKGQIWLDQLHCAGNESSVSQCLHSPWGDNNCQHIEDASVICSPGDTRQSVVPHKVDASPQGNNIAPAHNILPSECGHTNLDHFNLLDEQNARVVGGNDVLKGSYPWQASVRVRTGGKSVHWCGAVVISPLHVLTAGHCMQDYTKGAYFVRVGDHDTEQIEGTEQELNIDEIYLHEEFNKGRRLNNDIAVVKLKGLGIRLGPEIMPACLPHHNFQFSPGLNCTISGWGSIKAAGSGYARRLRAAWIPLLPHETCKASFVYGTNAIGDGMFCAGQLEGGVDSCQGDSGGPLVCFVNGEFTLYGITSWGHGCGRANKPGVYSNVGYYRDWIDRKLEDSMSGR